MHPVASGIKFKVLAVRGVAARRSNKSYSPWMIVRSETLLIVVL